MKVLVTGGAGFIGSHLVDALVHNNHQVTVLDIRTKQEAVRGNLKMSADEILYLQGNIVNEGDVMDAMENADAVAHLAALTSVPESEQQPDEYCYINIEGTMIVSNIARKLDKKLVFASSAAVYGNATEQEEGLEGRMRSCYGTTKLAGEDRVEMAGGISLRMFNVYGARQDAAATYAGVIPKFISRLNEDKRPIIYGDGKNTRDFVHVSDVVQAFMLALESDKSGIYNIGTGRPTSVRKLLKILCDTMDKPYNPLYRKARSEEIKNSRAIITQAEEHLKYAPKVALEDGLKTVIEWYCR